MPVMLALMRSTKQNIGGTMTLNRNETLRKLVFAHTAVEFESPDDEGAMEHLAELESVMTAFDEKKSDEEIIKAAEWVGVQNLLVYR
jgi:hypothetical protein